MSCEVSLQPLPLRRAGTTTTCISTIGIQGDQMPGADIIAIVALAWLASGRPKVIKVTGGTCIGSGTTCATRGEVLVISNDWMRDSLHPSPAQIIGLQKSLIPSAVILVITQREDGCKVCI